MDRCGKVQGWPPIVELRRGAQTHWHVDGGVREMNMVGNAAWSPQIGGLFATRRRRWMQRHPAPTFVFVDLAGYTALTETRGDHAAARVAGAFQPTMSGLSRRHGAWQIKAM